MWLSALLGSSPAWQWVPSAPFDDFSGRWRTSQEGAWCLARSDTGNWIRQDSGTRKLFSFQFYSAEVRENSHSMFISAQGHILQDDTEYFQFLLPSLGTEGPQPVTGLDLFFLFLIISYHEQKKKPLIFISKSIEILFLAEITDHLQMMRTDQKWHYRLCSIRYYYS